MAYYKITEFREMVYFSFGTKSVYPILTDLLDVGWV